MDPSIFCHDPSEVRRG